MTPPKTPAERAAERIIVSYGCGDCDPCCGGRYDQCAVPVGLLPVVMASIITAEYASIEQENEAFKANPQVGTCCMCGSAIWHKEARMTDERGTFHPICAIKQENETVRGMCSRQAATITDMTQENQRLKARVAELETWFETYGK